MSKRSLARFRHMVRNEWRDQTGMFRVLPDAFRSKGARSVSQVLILSFLVFLTSCGNPPSNSNNTNFPFGIAVCSYQCNVPPIGPSTITTPFAAVTSYGSHQILIFTTNGTTSSPNPFGFEISGTPLPPTTSLYNTLQGPDGVLISSQSFTANGVACDAPVLFGADGVGNKIGIWCKFDPTNTSNPPPTITINSTSFVAPEGMALDWVDSSGNTLTAPLLFVANPGSSNILAFDLRQISSTGNITLSPSGGLLPGTDGGLPFGQPANITSLNGPAFVAFSNTKNTLFVSNTGNSQVNIYGNGYCLGVNLESNTGCAQTSQNVTPTVWFSGINTYLSTPSGIIYYQGSLYVADYSANAVLIWDNVLNTASPGGNIAPTRRINGTNTNLSNVYAISIDSNPTAPPGNIFYLSQVNSGDLLGFTNATTTSGNISPTYTVNVINPTLSSGFGGGGGTTGYPGFY